MFVDGTVIFDKDKADAFNNKSISVNKEQHVGHFPVCVGWHIGMFMR